MKVDISFKNKGLQKIGPRGGQFAWVILIPLIFGMSQSPWPLYVLSQPMYFLHGLAAAGRGFLAGDWAVNTIDPMPVFSFLVFVTARFLHENVFHFYYLILAGIYFGSIFKIVSRVYPVLEAKEGFLIFFAGFTAIHSYLFYHICFRLFGTYYGKDFFSIFHAGFANQTILGAILAPSSFGVLLLASIGAFLSGRSYLAVTLLALTSTIHPTYLLSSAFLTLSYLPPTLTLPLQDEGGGEGGGKEKGEGIKKVLGLVLLAFLLHLPIVSYVFSNFHSTSPEISQQAAKILVEDRIAVHANPAAWLWDWRNAFRLAVMLGALTLVRRTRVLLLLLIPFLAGTILTAIQIFTGSDSLALLFPWRVSVFLVPISTAVLLGGGIESYLKGGPEKKSWPLVKYLSLASLFIFFLTGSVKFAFALKRGNTQDSFYGGLTEFVKKSRMPGDLYLVPPGIEFESFRISAGVPIFVDFSTHPYKDVEVIEWDKRFKLAGSFYENLAKPPCGLLAEILKLEPRITHLVLPAGEGLSSCVEAQSLFMNQRFRVSKLNERND